MNITKLKRIRRQRRKQRVRKHIFGTPERLRLSVYRSVNHIYAQIIDDTTSATLVAASTQDKDILEQVNAAKGKVEQSKLVGMALARKAAQKSIKTVVFDRNGYMYHGRIKALADGAREGGLDF